MKTLKKISILLMIFILLFFGLYYINSNATDIYSKITTMATSDGGGTAVNSANKIAGSVISIAKVICAGVAIIMLTVIAMKYMLAAPSEKADIKKHAVVYVVGAVVMFAATGILQIIQSFASVLE